MTDLSKLSFIDNNAAVAQPDKFSEIVVDTRAVVESWRSSLFSFEWLNGDGTIKSYEQLSVKEQVKRQAIERMVEDGHVLAKPVLGLGLEDHVEIGAGREVLLTLCAMGMASMPVHIPRSCVEDFAPFRTKETQDKGGAERGNVLFYILIAVGLIGALAYAISQSQRGNTNDLEESRARIIAGEVVEISDLYANAVAQLRLRGVADTDLCFDDPVWADYERDEDYAHSACGDRLNRLYHPDGAGLSWGRLPRDAFDSAQQDEHKDLFHFIGDNEILNVGTTCSQPRCAELLYVVDGLRRDVCIKINDLIGVENDASPFDETIVEPPEDTSYGTARFRGRYGFAETIGDSTKSRALDGRLAGCFESQSQDTYAYYKVLVAR